MWTTAPVSSRSGPAGAGESSNLRHQGGSRCKASATGPRRTGEWCRPAGRIPKSIQDAFAAAHRRRSGVPLKRFTWHKAASRLSARTENLLHRRAFAAVLASLCRG